MLFTFFSFLFFLSVHFVLCRGLLGDTRKNDQIGEHNGVKIEYIRITP